MSTRMKKTEVAMTAAIGKLEQATMLRTHPTPFPRACQHYRHEKPGT